MAFCGPALTMLPPAPDRPVAGRRGPAAVPSLGGGPAPRQPSRQARRLHPRSGFPRVGALRGLYSRSHSRVPAAQSPSAVALPFFPLVVDEGVGERPLRPSIAFRLNRSGWVHIKPGLQRCPVAGRGLDLLSLGLGEQEDIVLKRDRFFPDLLWRIPPAHIGRRRGPRRPARSPHSPRIRRSSGAAPRPRPAAGSTSRRESSAAGR